MAVPADKKQFASAAVAIRLFDSIEAGDIAAARACFVPHAVVWYSIDQTERPRDAVAATLQAMVNRMSDITYSNRRLQPLRHGFVQQHVLEATRRDGKRIGIPVAVIAQVEKGLIVRIDEYMDSALVAEFRKIFD